MRKGGWDGQTAIRGKLPAMLSTVLTLDLRGATWLNMPYWANSSIDEAQQQLVVIS